MEFSVVSSLDLCHRTRKESLEITCLSDFRYLAPFRRYSRSKSEVVENRPKFCMFLVLIFFGGGAPEFLDSIYKTSPLSDHVAKFEGDRSRDLGGNLAKEIKKKHHGQNRRLPVRTRDSRKSRKHGNHGNRDFRQMPWFCQNTVFAVFLAKMPCFSRFCNKTLSLISVIWSLLCDFNTKKCFNFASATKVSFCFVTYWLYICPWRHHRNI